MKTITGIALVKFDRELRSNDAATDYYTEALDLATKYGMEYEIERAKAAIEEMADDRDDIMGRALEAGFGPDDFAEDLW